MNRGHGPRCQAGGAWRLTSLRQRCEEVFNAGRGPMAALCCEEIVGASMVGRDVCFVEKFYMLGGGGRGRARKPMAIL